VNVTVELSRGQVKHLIKRMTQENIKLKNIVRLHADDDVFVKLMATHRNTIKMNETIIRRLGIVGGDEVK
jgi:hypothetical protein